MVATKTPERLLGTIARMPENGRCLVDESFLSGSAVAGTSLGQIICGAIRQQSQYHADANYCIY